MKIEISDIREGTVYVAEHVSDCKDSTDASAFVEAVRCGDVVTMGMVVARPVEVEREAR